MAKQDTSITLTRAQKEVLDLEKKYFEKLQAIISSIDFQNDLRSIEAEIQLNYTRLAATWNVKNKIKVAAERVVRHHVYKNLMPEISGIYESPISSDLGIVFNDCVLCIDCKTLDTDSNSTDINYTSVEPNQTSFDNSNYPYIETSGNLESRARISRLPVLTYIVKIIYRDDNVRFDLSRSTGIHGKPSLILTCIPNGELSNLFDKNIIVNFKTYKYYTENDGVQYTPLQIPAAVVDKAAWVERNCLTRGYGKITISQGRGTKDIFYDAPNRCYWVYTSDNNKKMVRAILRGDSMRLNNAYLKERYDADGNPWDGYIQMDV